MDNFTNFTYSCLYNYFKTLSVFGYKGYNDVNKLIILLSIESLLSGPFTMYLSDEDYKDINKALYCLFDSSCLIPYPDSFNKPVLVQSFNYVPRISEDNILRISEDELFRLINT